MSEQMKPRTYLSGLRIYPGYLDRDGQADLLAAVARCLRVGTAVHAAHAEVGPAVYGAHVKLRAAWMGVGRERVPVSADASRDRPALATDAGGARQNMG